MAPPEETSGEHEDEREHDRHEDEREHDREHARRRERILSMTPIERMEEAYRLYKLTGGNPPAEVGEGEER